MTNQKSFPAIGTLIMYSIFAIIASTILINSIQLYTLELTDILQVYLYVYLFSFLPLFLLILIVLLQPSIDRILIISLCLYSFLIIFLITTSISIIVLNVSDISLIARFINIFKYLPVYVLEQDDFGFFVLIVNIFEMGIFLLMAFLYDNNVKKTKHPKKYS
jgi:hypothetical protein